MASAKKNSSDAVTQAKDNANTSFGPLNTGAQQMVNSQGYDPATLSAITNASMGANNAAFTNASGQVNRDAARTKNPAGTAGQLDTLAMDKGIAGGNAAGGVEIANQNFKNQQRMQGLNLLNSTYGTSLNAQQGEIGNQIKADQAPFQDLNSILTGVGAVIPKAGPGAKF